MQRPEDCLMHIISHIQFRRNRQSVDKICYIRARNLNLNLKLKVLDDFFDFPEIDQLCTVSHTSTEIVSSISYSF